MKGDPQKFGPSCQRGNASRIEPLHDHQKPARTSIREYADMTVVPERQCTMYSGSTSRPVYPLSVLCLNQTLLGLASPFFINPSLKILTNGITTSDHSPHAAIPATYILWHLPRYAVSNSSHNHACQAVFLVVDVLSLFAIVQSHPVASKSLDPGLLRPLGHLPHAFDWLCAAYLMEGPSHSRVGGATLFPLTYRKVCRVCTRLSPDLFQGSRSSIRVLAQLGL